MPVPSIFQDKKVLITAGPTQESLDPVRYISNHSSGKMGYAIAESFLNSGAIVYLVSGPVHLKIRPHPNLLVVNTNSASDMYLACCRFFEESDIAVFAAAVADYRPQQVAEQKIKKTEDHFTIKMVKNIDIAYEFGRIKTPAQFSVGFALETGNELEYAIGKLQKKNFDLVVLNSMNDVQAGFGYDTNKVSMISCNLYKRDFPLKSKKDVANDIVQTISDELAIKFPVPIANDLYEYETMYW